MERLKSRKMWAAIVVFFSATALLVAGNIMNDQWVDIVKWIGGFYLVGQGTVDAVTKIREGQLFGFDIAIVLGALGAAVVGLVGVFLGGRRSGAKKEQGRQAERTAEGLEDFLEDVKHAASVRARPDPDPKRRLREQSAGATDPGPVSDD